MYESGLSFHRRRSFQVTTETTSITLPSFQRSTLQGDAIQVRGLRSVHDYVVGLINIARFRPKVGVAKKKAHKRKQAPLR